MFSNKPADQPPRFLTNRLQRRRTGTAILHAATASPLSRPGPGPSSMAAAAAGQLHGIRSRPFAPRLPLCKPPYLLVAQHLVPKAAAFEAEPPIPGGSVDSASGDSSAKQGRGSGASGASGPPHGRLHQSRRRPAARCAAPRMPPQERHPYGEEEDGKRDWDRREQGQTRSPEVAHKHVGQRAQQQEQQEEEDEEQLKSEGSAMPAGAGSHPSSSSPPSIPPSSDSPMTTAASASRRSSTQRRQRSNQSGNTPRSGLRAANAAATSPTIAPFTTPAATPAAAVGSGPDRDFTRLPDGRQLVIVNVETTAAYGAGALSRALGREGRAVVRFNGGAGGLKGLRVLTLANIFMGQFNRALSFVVDVAPLYGQALRARGEKLQAGDVSFGYRVMARSRGLEVHEERLTAALRKARFFLDLSINVRQAWDAKGDVDEEQAYDLADAFYAALAAQQADEDDEEKAAAETTQRPRPQEPGQGAVASGGGGVNGSGGGRAASESDGAKVGLRRLGPQLPPPQIFVTADLAQGLTTFTGLGLLQRRLREERQQAVVEVTIYRCSVSAPRLDGRDGWVFGVRLGFEDPYLPRSSYRPSYTSAAAVAPVAASERPVTQAVAAAAR